MAPVCALPGIWIPVGSIIFNAREGWHWMGINVVDRKLNRTSTIWGWSVTPIYHRLSVFWGMVYCLGYHITTEIKSLGLGLSICPGMQVWAATTVRMATCWWMASACAWWCLVRQMEWRRSMALLSPQLALENPTCTRVTWLVVSSTWQIPGSKLQSYTQTFTHTYIIYIYNVL